MAGSRSSNGFHTARSPAPKVSTGATSMSAPTLAYHLPATVDLAAEGRIEATGTGYRLTTFGVSVVTPGEQYVKPLTVAVMGVDGHDGLPRLCVVSESPGCHR